MNAKFRGRILGTALCSAVICCCAVQTASATQYYSESFTYSDGSLTSVSGGLWTAHSGAGSNPVPVSSGTVVLTSGSGSREDVNRAFTTLASGESRYASFKLIVPSTSSVPAGGEYFASFLQSTNFRARVWLLQPVTSGFRLGVSDSGTAPTGASVWASDLSFDTPYQIVIRYSFDGTTRMWVSPASEASTFVSATGTANTAITGFALRQGTNACSQIIDDVCTSDTFSDVINCGGPPPVTGACCNGGTCTPGLTQAACQSGGGIYLGDGSVCGQDICTPGACCVANNCQLVIAAQCTTLGGSFEGPGTVCTPTPCGPTGACCSQNFSCTNNLTSAECAALDPNATWYEASFCNAVCGATGACCELDGSCTLNVIQTACTATNGRWTEGASSCTNCTAVSIQPVIISEYYESAPGNRKAIELYNTSSSTISLDGHLLANYANGSATPSATSSLNGISIPGNGVVVFINNATDDIPNFDENASNVYTRPGVMNFNGNDAVAILFIDATTVVDIFGVPTDSNAGPRGSMPYQDSAWERKCFVTVGNNDFDSCNFDGEKACGAPGCPRGTNPPLDCLNGVNYDQWIFEGLNPDTDNGNHSLGVHDCSGPLPTGACCPQAGDGRGAGCCPGDLSADNTVDLNDVPLFVAALLNNVYDSCADMNGDNADNGADIQAFVAAVFSGGNCGGLEECTVLTQPQCLALGGLYLGDGTNCIDNQCPAGANGACCTPTGCVDGYLASECQTAGGIFFGLGTTCANVNCNVDTSAVVINEIRIDMTGTDTDEYFELAGPPGTLLNGLTLLVIGDESSSAGSVPGDQSGYIERAYNLNGQIIPADGRFLAATSTFTLNGAIPDFIMQNGADAFENSDNLSFLLVTEFTGAVGDIIDDNRDGIPNAILPWTSINDWVSVRENGNPPPAANDEWVYDFSPAPGAIVGPDGAFAPGHVYRNDPNTNTDGAGTPWQIGPFNPVGGDDTPGVPNVISGACCINGTQCNVLSRSACATAGGEYKGTGTNCTVNVCVGACCNGTSCTVVTDTDCSTIPNSLYLGDGTVCSPNPCGASCITIAEARALPDGTGVRVCGVLSSTIDTVSSPTQGSFQIQDTSGADGQAAITVFGTTGLGEPITTILSQVSEGQQIELTGTLSTFNGLLELVNGSTPLQLVSTGANVGAPAPVTITAAEFQEGSATAENYESEIVRVDCVVFNDGNGSNFFDGGSFGTNYTVTVDGQQIVCRVGTNSTTLQGQFIPVGPVNVIGIHSQFDSTDPRTGGYQLLLRKFEDVETDAPNCIPGNGACCNNGTCTIGTQAECILAGGLYLGDDTDCSAGCPGGDCLIISEVVDGDRTNGTPKWVEITNTGATDYTFTAGGVFIAVNGSVTKTVVNMTGTTILAGQSYVICGSSNSGVATFLDTYGFNPDASSSVINGNGDDVYGITDDATGANVIDIYGVLGVDGTGQPWEYTDRVAQRNQNASSSNGGLFDVSDWTITSVDSGTGGTDADSKLLLQIFTNPGTHVFDPCSGNQACSAPQGTRALVRCGGQGEPACTQSQTYCYVIVDAFQGNPNIPANCARCAVIDGGTVCVPCTGSCPDGASWVFRWNNYDGQGNDCYFEGSVLFSGGCLASGPGCPQGTFNEVAP